MLRVSLVFHAIVPLIDLNNARINTPEAALILRQLDNRYNCTLPLQTKCLLEKHYSNISNGLHYMLLVSILLSLLSSYTGVCI